MVFAFVSPGLWYAIGYWLGRREGWRDAEQKTRLEWLELFQHRQDRNSP